MGWSRLRVIALSLVTVRLLTSIDATMCPRGSPGRSVVSTGWVHVVERQCYERLFRRLIESPLSSHSKYLSTCRHIWPNVYIRTTARRSGTTAYTERLAQAGIEPSVGIRGSFVDWKAKVDLFEQLRREHEFGIGTIMV
jgi:hypothetical protein